MKWLWLGWVIGLVAMAVGFARFLGASISGVAFAIVAGAALLTSAAVILYAQQRGLIKWPYRHENKAWRLCLGVLLGPLGALCLGSNPSGIQVVYDVFGRHSANSPSADSVRSMMAELEAEKTKLLLVMANAYERPITQEERDEFKRQIGADGQGSIPEVLWLLEHGNQTLQQDMLEVLEGVTKQSLEAYKRRPLSPEDIKAVRQSVEATKATTKSLLRRR